MLFHQHDHYQCKPLLCKQWANTTQSKCKPIQCFNDSSRSKAPVQRVLNLSVDHWLWLIPVGATHSSSCPILLLQKGGSWVEVKVKRYSCITILYCIRECCIGSQSWEWSTAPHPSISCRCWRVTAAYRTLTVWTAWRRPGRYSRWHSNTYKPIQEWLCSAVYLDLVNGC